MNPSDERIAVGKIIKPHGVRGEVSVLVLTEVPERFETGSTLWLETGEALQVDRSRRHQGGFILSFTQVRDRNGADSLHGKYLFVPESDLPELPDGSYWPHQIEGCAVVTDEGRSLGVITEVLHTEANDVWVATPSPSGRDGDEILIPALKETIGHVDLDAKRIVVRDSFETE